MPPPLPSAASSSSEKICSDAELLRVRSRCAVIA